MPAPSPMPSPGRVCILTTVHHPRDDRVFHKQALSLARAGYEVSMVAGWAPEMESGPVRRLPLPAFRGRTDRLVRGAWLAFRLAVRAKADVYQFHDPDLLPVGLALKLWRKRVIYDVHEDYSLKVRSRSLPTVLTWIASAAVRALETVCAWTFDHIVTADSHVASLFPARKTTVIANYPPIAFLRTATPDSSHDGGGPLRLAYVGAISRARGIPQILQALDLVGTGAAELHIAGPSTDGDLIRSLKQHAAVKYYGVLPWEQVTAVLGQCDVGLLILQPTPAYVYCPGENVIKLWEYLGMSLPVIVSDFPRLKALVERLEVGVTVDPEQPRDIAAAISRLRDDPELRRRLGRNGRAVVLRERNWDTEAMKLVKLYERLLSGRSAAPAPQG